MCKDFLSYKIHDSFGFVFLFQNWSKTEWYREKLPLYPIQSSKSLLRLLREKEKLVGRALDFRNAQKCLLPTIAISDKMMRTSLIIDTYPQRWQNSHLAKTSRRLVLQTHPQAPLSSTWTSERMRCLIIIFICALFNHHFHIANKEEMSSIFTYLQKNLWRGLIQMRRAHSLSSTQEEWYIVSNTAKFSNRPLMLIRRLYHMIFDFSHFWALME